MLVDDGILLFKYWLAVDQDEQEKRFAERIEDPTKRWKLSPIDVKARDKYRDYGKARVEMFSATHTKKAPWTVVDFNDQKLGRLNLIRHLLDQLPDHAVPDTKIVTLLRHTTLPRSGKAMAPGGSAVCRGPLLSSGSRRAGG